MFFSVRGKVPGENREDTETALRPGGEPVNFSLGGSSSNKVPISCLFLKQHFYLHLNNKNLKVFGCFVPLIVVAVFLSVVGGVWDGLTSAQSSLMRSWHYLSSLLTSIRCLDTFGAVYTSQFILL